MEGNQTLSEIITDLYRTYYNLIRNILTLAMIDARQAKWTIVKMAVLILMVILLMSFTWLGICTVIGIFLAMQGVSLMVSVLSVTMLNIFLMLLSVTYILAKKKDIFFSATTSQLDLAINASKDVANE